MVLEDPGGPDTCETWTWDSYNVAKHSLASWGNGPSLGCLQERPPCSPQPGQGLTENPQLLMGSVRSRADARATAGLVSRD